MENDIVPVTETVNSAVRTVTRLTTDDESSDNEYEDALDSPLEQRISASILKSNTLESIFSLVPSGVSMYKPSQSVQDQPDAISSPDAFSDFFQLLASSKRKRPRDELPFPRDRSTLNLWSLLKNLVGRDVTKIALPVHLNEPLSFTQRLVEDLEYFDLCHKAAAASTIHKRLAYLAALASSTFVSTLTRHSKPFNPLLGETYELVNKEGGYYIISEQVSHHPPVTAIHAESEKWVFWQEYTLIIKFRGQWVKIQPTGLMHFKTKNDGFHYSWNKPQTVIHNIILGSLWADHEGDVVVNCHNTGDKAVVTWSPYSKARERYRELNGKVLNDKEEVQYLLHGAWDKGMVRKNPDGSGVKEMWQAHEPVPNCERQYGFTEFTMILNEPDDSVTCPTDSRLRPDQRLLEDGLVDVASSEKHHLEEKQRVARRKRESTKQRWTPLWFNLYDDPDTMTRYHLFNGNYLKCKLTNDWSSSPDIF